MTADPLADVEAEPPCPDCGTDLYVHGAKASHKDWRCEYCGRRWST